MSAKKIAIMLTATLVLAALPAVAADTCPGAKSAATKSAGKACCETAVFTVPGLADEAVVKGLTTALAKQEGVLSAKADAEGGKFLVTFETAKTNSDAVTKAMTLASPEAKFDKVQAAAKDATEKHNCAGCPSKGSCPMGKGKAKDKS
jgi:hypothetical protein